MFFSLISTPLRIVLLTWKVKTKFLKSSWVTLRAQHLLHLNFREYRVVCLFPFVRPETRHDIAPRVVAHIIRQGRCTLVATVQMYKILALNCLISAYALSVQYLDGIKYGDYQVTITGMLMSVCFLCISRAKVNFSCRCILFRAH